MMNRADRKEKEDELKDRKGVEIGDIIRWLEKLLEGQNYTMDWEDIGWEIIEGESLWPCPSCGRTLPPHTCMNILKQMKELYINHKNPKTTSYCHSCAYSREGGSPDRDCKFYYHIGRTRNSCPGWRYGG